MIRWLLIPLLACQCWAGSTNWLAQRPGLVSDYGNVFVNEKVPAELLPNIRVWLPCAAPFPSIQYCFAPNYTNDFTVSGPVWTNSYGGGMSFNGGTDSMFRVINPNLYATTGQFSFVMWLFANGPGGGSAGRLLSCQSYGEGYIINTFSTKLRFLNSALTAVEGANNSFITGKVFQAAGTYNNGAVVLYTNGAQTGSGTIAACGVATIPLHFGNDGLNLNRGFDGILYDFKFFNRVLAAGEVSGDWNTYKTKYGIP